jgi:Ca2+/Na+ antiporter
MAKGFTSKKNRSMLALAIKFAGFIVTAIVAFFTIQHFTEQQKSTATTFPTPKIICGVTVFGSNNTVVDNGSNSTFNCPSKESKG